MPMNRNSIPPQSLGVIRRSVPILSGLRRDSASTYMKITFLTIFPKMFACYINESILKRAQTKGLVKFKLINIRDFAADKHKTVDDKPYGGGPGMLLKIEPIYKALRAITKKQRNKETEKRKIILLSAKGKTFDQKMAEKLSKYNHLVFICGRYEGVDERVAKYLADEEISIGNYVLTGGELPAMVIADTVTRLIPGVIKKESLKEESFTPASRKKLEIGNWKLEIKHEYPQYTRPEKFLDWQVPKILLSGDHKKIEEWRGRKALNSTKERK